MNRLETGNSEAKSGSAFFGKPENNYLISKLLVLFRYTFIEKLISNDKYVANIQINFFFEIVLPDIRKI